MDRRLKDLGEFGLISRIRQKTGNRSPDVITGIGDDAAMVAVAGERLLLATCDAQIDGVHFQRRYFSPEEIGARAAAVNLSDIAAMGGRPTFALVSLIAPPDLEVAFAERLYDGIQGTLSTFGAEIVGGNTAAAPERLAIDLTMLGEVARDRALRRDGAAPGDLLCVTGVLGASRAGRMLLDDSSLALDETDAVAALRAHRTPTPRVEEGRVLGRDGNATACIDISDGLLGDVGHLAASSGVSITVDVSKLPVAGSALAVARLTGEVPAVLAATGGEDFELLFTVPEASAAGLMDRVRDATGTPVSPVGEVTSGDPGVQLTGVGSEDVAAKSGFDHFFAL